MSTLLPLLLTQTSPFLFLSRRVSPSFTFVFVSLTGGFITSVFIITVNCFDFLFLSFCFLLFIPFLVCFFTSMPQGSGLYRFQESPSFLPIVCVLPCSALLLLLVPCCPVFLSPAAGTNGLVSSAAVLQHELSASPHVPHSR